MLTFNIVYCNFMYCTHNSELQHRNDRQKWASHVLVQKKEGSPHFLEKDRIFSHSPDFKLSWITWDNHVILLSWKSGNLSCSAALMQNTHFTTRDKYFSWCSLAFHHFKGSWLSSSSGSSASYSFAAISSGDSDCDCSLGPVMSSKYLASFLLLDDNSLGSGSVAPSGICWWGWSASMASKDSQIDPFQDLIPLQAIYKRQSFESKIKYTAMKSFILTTSSFYWDIRSSLMAVLILFVRHLSLSASAKVWENNLRRSGSKIPRVGYFSPLSQLHC